MAFDTNSLADALMSATPEQLREDAAVYAKAAGTYDLLAAGRVGAVHHINLTVVACVTANLYGRINMSIQYDFIKLARMLEDNENAAFNLWTWLPSYIVAEKHHDDYAGEFRPTVAEIMNEACTFIAALHDSATPVVELREQMANEVECPCGELHTTDDSDGEVY